MLTCEKPTAPSGAQETDDSSTTHNYGAIITYKCTEENSRFGPDVTTNKQELTIACQLNTDTNVMSYQSLTDEQICVEVEDPIVTVDLDTVIESTFEIDIACDQTQEDSAKNSFSAAFAGIIQDLQNTNENYKDFSVKDVVCDSSNGHIPDNCTKTVILGKVGDFYAGEQSNRITILKIRWNATLRANGTTWKLNLLIKWGGVLSHNFW